MKYIQVIKAFRQFREARTYKCKTHYYRHYRDQTKIRGDWITYYYHGSPIAMYSPKHNELIIDNAGYVTPTTRDRLNAILREFNIPHTVGIRKNYEIIYLYDPFKYIGMIMKKSAYYLRAVFDLSTGELKNVEEFIYYIPGNKRETYYPKSISPVSKNQAGIWRELAFRIALDDREKPYVYMIFSRYENLMLYKVALPNMEARYYRMKYISMLGGWIGVEDNDIAEYFESLLDKVRERGVKIP